jgi:hypothetical protein
MVEGLSHDTKFDGSISAISCTEREKKLNKVFVIVC